MATRTAARYLEKLDPFHSDSETITAYLERVELFFQTNEVAAEKEVAVFLSIIGGKTYMLLRNLHARLCENEGPCPLQGPGATLTLTVVQGDGQSLLGRDCLTVF